MAEISLSWEAIWSPSKPWSGSTAPHVVLYRGLPRGKKSQVTCTHALSPGRQGSPRPVAGPSCSPSSCLCRCQYPKWPERPRDAAEEKGRSAGEGFSSVGFRVKFAYAVRRFPEPRHGLHMRTEPGRDPCVLCEDRGPGWHRCPMASGTS